MLERSIFQTISFVLDFGGVSIYWEKIPTCHDFLQKVVLVKTVARISMDFFPNFKNTFIPKGNDRLPTIYF